LARLLRQNWHREPLRGKVNLMKQSETIYPDIFDILKAKAERRRDIARRSFGEKVAMMEALRERVAPLRRAREQRRAAKRVHSSGVAS
jgi:hypothetical protein